MSDVAERVRKVTAKLLKVDLDEVKPEARFVQDLGADSTASLELFAAFEAEFEIEMDWDKASAVKTVGKAIPFIEKVIAEQHK